MFFLSPVNLETVKYVLYTLLYSNYLVTRTSGREPYTFIEPKSLEYKLYHKREPIKTDLAERRELGEDTHDSIIHNLHP